MFIACLLIGYTYIYRHKELQRNKRDIKELQHEYDILLTVKDKISNQYQVIEKHIKTILRVFQIKRHIQLS